MFGRFCYQTRLREYGGEVSKFIHTRRGSKRIAHIGPEDLIPKKRMRQTVVLPSTKEAHRAYDKLCFGGKAQKMTDNEKRELVALLPALSCELFSVYDPADANHSEKTTKSDDAEVPTYLWDSRIAHILGQSCLTDEQVLAADKIRPWMHRKWVRNVQSSWWNWWVVHKSVI